MISPLNVVRAFNKSSQDLEDKRAAFPGGFDILKRWQARETGREQQKEPGYYSSGFDIVRKWEEEHGKQYQEQKKRKDIDQPFSGGFDILEKFQESGQ